eukprot:TRINITY_DN18968_c0_g1_i1.p1 TRINITY_DN18968_c0_g1~~TRINITY_DN18968_c0_g1_i1.p1  ORF type:complete len:284 (-),score=39.62 TRINITY_DN18968_c0_g1_i1:144-995(-)
MNRPHSNSLRVSALKNKLESSRLECSCVRSRPEDSSDGKACHTGKSSPQKEHPTSNDQSDQYHPSPEQLKNCKKLKIRKRSGNNAHPSPTQIMRQSHKLKDHSKYSDETNQSNPNSDSEVESSLSLIHDDYLETLDRKVSKIINRKPSFTTNPNDELHRSHSDRFYGPLSFNYRAPSSGKLGSAADIPDETSMASQEGIFYNEGDDEDSNQEGPSRNWSDEKSESSDYDTNEFALRRRSFARRPIRTGSRFSITSLPCTVSSNTLERKPYKEFDAPDLTNSQD